jgi:hypothetical protein
VRPLFFVVFFVAVLFLSSPFAMPFAMRYFLPSAENNQYHTASHGVRRRNHHITYLDGVGGVEKKKKKHGGGLGTDEMYEITMGYRAGKKSSLAIHNRAWI